MSEKSLEHHVNELRNRLKHSFIVLIGFTGIGFYYSKEILEWLQADLMLQLNALKAYEVMYTRLTIALLFGFFLALPVLIYHALKFTKPGLKTGEYRVLRNYLPFSILLFIGGAAFSYEFIVKSSLSFFRSMTSGSDVAAVWGLQSTLGFALKLSAFSGLMFQLPIVAMVLSKAGLIDTLTMKTYRAYFFVSVLLLAAVATPPDIITQVLLTAPVMGLYQLSIFLVGLTEP